MDSKYHSGKQIYQYLTAMHLFCVLILMFSLIINKNLFYGEDIFPVMNVRLYILVCLIGVFSVFLYNTWVNRAEKSKSYFTGVKLFYVSLPLIIAVIILFFLAENSFSIEVMFIIPVMIAASVLGKTAGLTMSTVCSAVLVAHRVFIKNESIFTAFETELVAVFTMFIVGWYIGTLTEIEAEQRKNLRTNLEVLEKEMEKRSLAEQQQKALLDGIPDIVWLKDREGRFVAVNKSFERECGVTSEGLLGKTDLDVWQMDFAEKYIKDDITVLQSKAMKKVEEIVEDQHGKRKLYETIRVPIQNDIGDVIGTAGISRDITERKKVEEQLRHLSLCDPITNLYNRTYFEKELLRLGQGRSNQYGIVVCDVDGLKLVNDTLGHNVGDEVLIAVANIIKSSFRVEDMVARIGGDEFAVLLPEVNEAAIKSVTSRIRNGIKRYNATNPEIPLSVSVGYALSGKTTKDVKDLFKEADNNMYREKLLHSQSARSAIVQTLMKALEERDFVTEGHADRLQDIVIAMAAEIDLPENRTADLQLLAQFHDIGKVGIPDKILFKKGPLTPEERDEMCRHSEIGYRIAMSAPDLVPIAELILKHHEWWNGKGYPFGLKGKEIPLECRILAIADAYDAMISDRPYRKGGSPVEAVAELKRCAGTQFDPYLINKFVKVRKSLT